MRKHNLSIRIISVATILSVFAISSLNKAFLAYAEEGEGSNPYSTPQEGYTRYEAEDAFLEDCVAKGKVEDSPADYGNYSGLGFVGSIDNNDAALTFTINVEEEGNYPVYVGYAIDKGFGNAGLTVIINGEFYQTWSFKQKEGWGNFAGTVPLFTSLNLGAGSNKVKLQHSYNYVEIDYLDIGPCQGTFIDPGQNTSEMTIIPDGYTRYEAENGNVQGGNIYKVIAENSGTGFVGELDYAGRSQITWNVSAAEDGLYNIRIAYAIGTGSDFRPATMKLLVNGNLYNMVRFTEKNGWGVFTTDAICESTVSLLAGVNAVTLAKAGEFAQLDFIDISNEKVGEWREVGYELTQPNLLEGYTRYEAEEAYVVLAEPKGIGFYIDMGSYSGKGYVGSLDRDSYYVEFPINVAEDGKYAIRVGYACLEEGASLRFYNGTYGRGGGVYFDNEVVATNISPEWGTFTDETIFETTINLKKGNSFIIVRSGFIRCEIDYLDLGAKVGEYEQGEFDSTLDRHNY